MDGSAAAKSVPEQAGPAAPREPLPTAANARPRPAPDAVFSGMSR
ncbi:MAG TPA: hypothetical protein VMU95_35595 [Trebonia sp.]|nr:hypothetical protein [Trebonia sp.]